MNSQNNKKIFFFLITFFVIVLITSIWFVFYILKKSDSLDVSLEKIKELRTQNVVEMKQTIRNLDTAVTELDNFFVEKDAAVNFINKIEELAGNVGLIAEIQNVTLDDRNRVKKEEVDGEIISKDVRGGGELVLAIQTRGDWNKIMDFLSILEKIDKRITINGLRLSSSVDGESTKVIWTAIFNISVLTN